MGVYSRELESLLSQKLVFTPMLETVWLKASDTNKPLPKFSISLETCRFFVKLGVKGGCVF